jgi:carbohydrate-selective porin OprB
VPSWLSARISRGMQYAGPHARKRDVYGVGIRLNPWFVTGLTEGEGCFCVSFAVRPKLKVGVEARPSFALSLNERDRELPGELQTYFRVRLDPRVTLRPDLQVRGPFGWRPLGSNRSALRGVPVAWREASRVHRGSPGSAR